MGKDELKNREKLEHYQKELKVFKSNLIFYGIIVLFGNENIVFVRIRTLLW